MTERWYKRSRPRRRTIVAASTLVVIILLLSFAPTFIARYFIADILDDFGIEHEGISSIRINIWKREVWAGPVRFHSGDVGPGQLGEIGIKVHLFPVLKKHALIEKVLVQGMDLYVQQDKESGFALNGVPLNQFISEADAGDAKNDIDDEGGWGAGLVQFEVQDSRLIFKDQTGGSLTIKIDRFTLEDFQTWEPDSPGTVMLKGSINGVMLDLTGNARPFAQHITVNLDARTQELDLSKIIEFTGPLGFDRKEGVYASNLHHEITLFDTGRLEGHAVGQIEVRGADYEQANKFAIAVELADIDIDTRYSLSKADKLSVDGQFDITLAKLAGDFENKNAFSIDAAQVKVGQLNTSLDADKAFQLKANPRVDITKGRFSGRVQLSMDVLLDVLRYLSSISAPNKVTKDTIEETGLDEWADEEVTLPPSDITVTKLESNVSAIELKTAGGQVTLDLEADSKVTDIVVATDERSTNVNSLRSKLDFLQLSSKDDELAVKVKGSNKLFDLKLKGPLGEGKIKQAGLSQHVELEIKGGDINIDGSAKAEIDETGLSLYKTDILPPASIAVGAINANLKKADFSLVNEKMLWKLDAGSSIDLASIEFAKDSLTAAKVKRIEVTRARADQDLNLDLDKVMIKGLDASVTRQLINGLVEGSPTKKSKQSTDQDSDQDISTKETLSKQTKNSPFEIKLNLFTAKGSKLRFRDEKVKPRVRLDLDIQTADVRDLDSRNLSQQSHASLVAKINEFTHLELNAQASNPGPNLNLSLNGKLDDLELPPFSSYAAEFGGVNIGNGQFHSQVDVTAKNGELAGLLKLNINDLEFTTLSEADAERLSETVGVPIETAASLLRDSKGNIDLSLPVKGTVVEPSVNISSAVSKAIGNTLKAVFPPTLIGSMLMSDTKEGTGLVFEPIPFKAGSSDLEKDALIYLNDLAELFKERPRLSLDICGRTTAKDFYAITLVSIELKPDAKPAAIEQRKKLLETHGPKLRELATERTRVTRRYLINERGLNVKQLGQCRAIFDPDDSDPPRAEVKL